MWINRKSYFFYISNTFKFIPSVKDSDRYNVVVLDIEYFIKNQEPNDTIISKFKMPKNSTTFFIGKCSFELFNKILQSFVKHDKFTDNIMAILYINQCRYSKPFAYQMGLFNTIISIFTRKAKFTDTKLNNLILTDIINSALEKTIIKFEDINWDTYIETDINEHIDTFNYYFLVKTNSLKHKLVTDCMFIYNVFEVIQMNKNICKISNFDSMIAGQSSNLDNFNYLEHLSDKINVTKESKELSTSNTNYVNFNEIKTNAPILYLTNCGSIANKFHSELCKFYASKQYNRSVEIINQHTQVVKKLNNSFDVILNITNYTTDKLLHVLNQIKENAVNFKVCVTEYNNMSEYNKQMLENIDKYNTLYERTTWYSKIKQTIDDSIKIAYNIETINVNLLHFDKTFYKNLT